MRQGPNTLGATTRTLQIVLAALMFGVVAYGVFTLQTGGLSDPPKPPVMAVIGAGFAILNFVLHLVVPALIERSAAGAQGDTSRLLSIYAGKTIVAGALLEGAAMTNVFAVSSEHHWWSLAIVVVLLLTMATLIPTSVSIGQWIEAKQLEVR